VLVGRVGALLGEQVVFAERTSISIRRPGPSGTVRTLRGGQIVVVVICGWSFSGSMR
jgi:hypothetical protein